MAGLLSIPQLQSIRLEDPLYYEAFAAIQDGLNNLSNKLGIAPSAEATSTNAATQENFPAPRPPASITVAAVVVGSSKIYGVLLGPSPDADDSIRYSVEFSLDSNFAGSTPVPIAQLNYATLLLPDSTFYWRARCQFPESAFSSYAYFGSQANPTGV